MFRADDIPPANEKRAGWETFFALVVSGGTSHAFEHGFFALGWLQVFLHQFLAAMAFVQRTSPRFGGLVILKDSTIKYGQVMSFRLTNQSMG